MPDTLIHRAASGAQCEDLRDAAIALAAVASIPNPHAVPIAPLQAMRTFSVDTPSGALMGFWPLLVRSPLPGFRWLQAPVRPLYDTTSLPLVRDGRETLVMPALLKAAFEEAPLIHARACVQEGAIWQALMALADDGRIRLTILKSWERALLVREAPHSTLTQPALSLSSSSRKRLRAKRRALEDQGGPLCFSVHGDAPDVDAAFERFVALEASGWKGTAGSALHHHAVDQAFVRETLRRLSASGMACVAELSQQGRPIASALLLRAGGDVTFWKTTYDEALSRSSPGVLLDLELTDWLIAQPWFVRLDTATDDSIDPSSLIWAGRRRMADVLIEPAGGSWQGRILQQGLALRGMLKRLRYAFASK